MSKIKPEDISLLSQLLQLPKSTVVFAPLGIATNIDLALVSDITQLLQQAKQYKACINLSGQALEVFNFDVILEPGRPQSNYKSLTGHHFLGFNNPDGTLRWFQSTRASHPHFLHLYNGNGWKAKLIKTITKWVFKIGLQESFSPAHFTLYSKDQDYLKRQYGTEEIALFTGTIGKNRKAVAAVCEGEKAIQYIKIPISDNARNLVTTEFNHLNDLAKFQFTYLEIPQVDWSGPNLVLSNILPNNPLNTANINTLHLKAVDEIFTQTNRSKILANTEIYQVTQQLIHKLRDQKTIDLAPEKKAKLYKNLKLLYRANDPNQLVSLCYAHGDFTPWNMFVSNQKIHVYDWELAIPEQLPLYDLFHYIFQSSILIHHQPFTKIKNKIEGLSKLTEVQKILGESRMTFWNCYHWYLLHNCSYYLDLYSRQEQLHPQANWLIDCWIEATCDAVSSPYFKNNAYLVSK